MTKVRKGDLVYNAPKDFDADKTMADALRAGLDVRVENGQMIIEKPKAPPHRVGYIGYDDIRTQRATAHDDNIAKNLLAIAAKHKAGDTTFTEYGNAVEAELVLHGLVDDRPLIDKLHEATFTDQVGLQWIEDKYALRMLLRKAHCFTLDHATSAMIADFSMAIATDLEAARRMAIPPFPVTWIEIDNHARLARIKALGVSLTENAATDAVERVGWLIHPDNIDGGYYATYFCEVDQGLTMSPLSYWWHVNASQPESLRPQIAERLDIEYLDRLSFGMKNSGVFPSDAIPSPTPMHIERMRTHRSDDPRRERAYPPQVRELMLELGGELRHIWGLLVALGAGQFGVAASHTPQPDPVTQRSMPNGKPLLPLRHKVLHLHLAKRTTVDKVIARAITHHKNCEHDVRAHFRALKNPDGTVRVRVPVMSHKRGDIRLGRIEKTYKVEK